ncbi:MAG: hypothetical protein K8I02_06020, partial [Candidatus Methylomirabilis sp.]|nr:hypothetical protein [Deltaproteobacteria bacterium]
VLLFAALVGLAPASARAGDLFVAFVRTADNLPLRTAAISGDSIVDLVEDFVRNQGAFAQFAGRRLEASLTYAGVPDALRFSIDGAGTQATLTLLTGYTRDFIAGDRASLFGLIEDFIQKDGSREWARLLRELAQTTIVGLTDGNPVAMTAVVADDAFRQFGLEASVTRAQKRYEEEGGAASGLQFRLDPAYTYIDTDVGKGNRITIAPALGYRFNDRFAVSLSIPFAYADIEGSEFYQGGLELGIPITLVVPDRRTPLKWQVTPWGVGAASGSVDYAAGGLIGGGGVTSLLAFDLPMGFTVSMGNQIGFYEGQTIDYDEYEFETAISQQIQKHGGRLSKTVGEFAFVDASLVWTDFIQDAAVDDYLTPGGGLGVFLGERSRLRVGYSADLGENRQGDKFRSHTGTVNFDFNF